MILFLQLVLAVGCSSSSVADGIIQIHALSKDGFVGALGGLYSTADSAVIPGLSVYKGGRIPAKDITMSSLGDTVCRSEVVHNEVEKNMAAGMDAEMEMPIYSGSVTLTGSSRVFNEFTVSEENVNAVLTYEHRSFQEVVDMENADLSVLSSANVGKYYATHVITGIIWGCQLHTTWQFKIGAGMNRSTFESEVTTELGFLSSRLEARANREVENFTVLRTSEYKMAFYSDVMLQKPVPTNLSEMIELVNSIPEAIKTSYSGKGSQRFYILTPIVDILEDEDQCNPSRNLTTSELTGEEDFLLRFTARTSFILNGEIKKLYSDLVKDYENYNFMVHPRSVLSLSELYLNYSTVYTKAFLPKIRAIVRNSKISSTERNTSEIQEMVSWYKSQPLGTEAVVNDLRYLGKIMKNKIIYNSIINENGARFLKQDGSISQVLLRKKTAEVFILLIPSDPNVTHTAGDVKNGVVKSSQTDVYDHWGHKLNSLFIQRGAKYVADCRFEDIPQCENLTMAVIQHYKRGYLVNRNLVVEAFEVWKTSEEVEGKMLDAIESFDKKIPKNFLGKR